MRSRVIPAVVAAFAVLAPSLRADVKTTEKTSSKLEGMLGTMSRMFARGGDAGVTSTVALKGDRKLSMSDVSGEIIDLAEQKVYRLDVKKKEYKVLTFDQVRKEWQDMQAEAEKNAKQLKDAQQESPEANQQLEFTADVKETGQTKSLAGYSTREVILTITGVHAGQTLEQGGGMVLTTTMWLAPKIAALDEIASFDMRYFKAIVGDENAVAAMQQLTAMFAMFANAKPMMDKMQAEGRKLAGTPLLSTTVMETVKSAAEMQAAGSGGSGGSGSGSGVSGMLAGRLAGRGRASSNSPHSTILTTTRELLTVATSATADDVAVPAGFKEKK